MLNEIFVSDNGAQGIPDHVVGHVGIPSLASSAKRQDRTLGGQNQCSEGELGHPTKGPCYYHSFFFTLYFPFLTYAILLHNND